MRITLVCASGITTSILATKLNTYAKEQAYNDFFVATRVSTDAEVLFTTSDILLIAPQAKASADKLKLEARSRNIPLIFFSEEDLVFGNVESIYAEINQYRYESEILQEEVKLTIRGILSIYGNTFLRCLPLQILALILSVVSNIFHLESEMLIFSVFPFYLAFAIGYEYGRFTKQSTLSMGLLFLASSAFILQIDNIQLLGEGITGVREGFIPLMPSTIKSYFLVVLIAFLTMISAYFSKNIFFDNKKNDSQVISSFIKLPIINGVVFATMLLFRLLFVNVFL